MEKWVHPHNCRGISALVEVLQTSAPVFPTPRILSQSKCSKNDHHSIVCNSEKEKDGGVDSMSIIGLVLDQWIIVVSFVLLSRPCAAIK